MAPRVEPIIPARPDGKEPARPDRTRSRRVTMMRGDKVWYVDDARGVVPRRDPSTGKVEVWRVPPGRRALPYAMAAADRDRVP